MTELLRTLLIIVALLDGGEDFVKWHTFGVTFYKPQDPWGACGPVQEGGFFAAVPAEWLLSGLVKCGDLVLVDFGPTGFEVPVGDSGCMLHWDVWDTGRPLAIDLPVWLDNEWTETKTAQIAIHSHSRDEWIRHLPENAWATDICHGPLSMHRLRGRGWEVRNR